MDEEGQFETARGRRALNSGQHWTASHLKLG